MELFGAADQAALGAEIVAEEKRVHHVAGGGKEPFVRLMIETADFFGGGVHEVRVRVHLDEIFLHAEQVTQVMEETGPESAEAVHVTGLAEVAQARFEVEEIGIRPWIFLNLLDGLAMGQRTDAAEFFPVEAGVEHRQAGRVLVDFLLVGLRADPPAVVVQLPAPFLFGARVEVTVQNRPGMDVRLAQPEPASFNILARDQAFDQFPAAHRAGLCHRTTGFFKAKSRESGRE